MKAFLPLVNIIIPVYNGQNYLQSAIESALNQTYKNIKVIVINDGSKDETEKIARSYNEVEYYRKENEGVASALNLGIKKAKGEYISWLSHDDVYLPNKIEAEIRTLQKVSPQMRNKYIIYSDYIFMDGNDKITQEVKLTNFFTGKQLADSLFPLFKQVIHGCTLLVPKQCFTNTRLFNVKLKNTQDYDLWFEMFPKYRLLHLPLSLIKSRQHSKQNSKTNIEAIVEGDELWTKMYKGITDKERAIIGGTLENFYTSSFSHMLMAKHFKAAQFLMHNTKSKNAKEKMQMDLNSYLTNEQGGRDLSAIKASKFYKVWRLYCDLKDRLKKISSKSV